jgi:RNA polymerase sigma-70 factor (ECF subfamily)
MIEGYYAALRRFLRARLRGHDSAEDLVQETYARALAARGAAALRLDQGTERAWLFQIAANLAVDFGRRERRRAGAFDFEAPIEALAAHEPRGGSPEGRLTVAGLIAAIEALPRRRRDVLILHKLEGYTHAEIAERLHISRDAVEKHVVRALADLRERLVEDRP